jgi:alpha-N-arabinofuranosidase
MILQEPNGMVISKYIYGHFSEHLGRCIYDGIWSHDSTGKGKSHLRMDIVDALKKIRVPVLRWPGGCFAEQYHWRDAVGPLSLRKRTVNTEWGMGTEDNSFGPDEFMQLCTLLGCEPYLAGNIGTGSPEEMEDWVEYMNYDGASTLADLRKKNGHAEPWHAAFWGIGNEVWGCAGFMTADTYISKFNQYAYFCKSYPGTPMKRIAAGAVDADYAWTEACMKGLRREMMWGLSLHYYVNEGRDSAGRRFAFAFNDRQYFNSMKGCLKMDELITRHGAIMDRYDPKRNIALVVDEWGNWTEQDPGPNTSLLYQQNTLRDALIAATTLNIFNNHCDRVKMANLTQTVNVVQAVILTRGDEMLLTPTYHVFDLFKVHQDARFLPITVRAPFYKMGNDSIPAVNASASEDSLGRQHISLVNLDPVRPLTVRVILTTQTGHTITGQVITSDKYTDLNTFEEKNKVVPRPFKEATLQSGVLEVALPAKSVVMLELKD